MKRMGIILLLTIALSLTGCMKDYALSEAETGIVAEYMAGLLIKYDDDRETSLIDRDELFLDQGSDDRAKNDLQTSTAPTPPADESESGNDESGSKENAESDAYTVSEVIGVEGLDIQYISYKLYNSYPEDETNSYFSITPREGNQLLVASFSIENKTNDNIKLDLRKADISYQLDINVGTIRKPYVAFIENDLRLINIMIEKNTTRTAVLIFEVPKDLDMSDINLIISRGSKAEIIEIK